MKPFAILTRYPKFQRENKVNKLLIEARRDLCGLSVRPSAEQTSIRKSSLASRITANIVFLVSLIFSSSDSSYLLEFELFSYVRHVCLRFARSSARSTGGKNSQANHRRFFEDLLRGKLPKICCKKQKSGLLCATCCRNLQNRNLLRDKLFKYIGGNTCNNTFQLATLHCCATSCKKILPILLHLKQ